MKQVFKFCCIVALGLCSALVAKAQTEQLTRETAFTYDAVTGQVKTERVDPGKPTCVETEYWYDGYGNREKVEVRPCAGFTTAEFTFAPRVTLNKFEAGSGHGAGAYLTATRSGATGVTWADTTGVVESRATFDARFGAGATATEVALADTTKNITKRTTYDTLGRVRSEFVPSKRNADNTVIENRVDHRTVYCKGSKAGTHTAPGTPVAADIGACLNIRVGGSATLPDVPVTYASQRLANAAGAAVAYAEVRVVSAYYAEAQALDSAGNAIAGRTRVHFDAMHREIAKETETYDGRWSRTMTAYDQLGQVAASWAPHFTDAAAADVMATRQWTSERDHLHRPVEARQFWRAEAAQASPAELRGRIEYNGLRVTSTVPADSASDNQVRSRVTVKNAAGQTAQTIDPYGATLNMAYDGFGNLVRTVDALGIATTIQYTAVTARFKTGQIDPNKGNWSYTYDAMGQLKTQTDARGKTTTLVYDALGRMVSKTTPTSSAKWSYGVYRTDPGTGQLTTATVHCAAGLPRLCQSWTGQDTVMDTRTMLVYDGLGRTIESRERLDREYVFKVSFDDRGRPATRTYPTGLQVRNAYGTRGQVVHVDDPTNPARWYWSLSGVPQPFDARGNLLKAKLGNGVTMNNAYDNTSGKVVELGAMGVGASTNNIFTHSYRYDKLNNLVRRYDAVAQVTESFVYDLLDRLTSYNVDSGAQSANRTVTVAYNAIGNILSKSDVGGYTYVMTDGNGGPHAVTTAGGTSYQYDANGNVISTTGAQVRTHTWTDFNLPNTMAYGGRQFTFQYDDQYKRVKEVVNNGGSTRVLYLVHPDNSGGLGFEREETWSGAPISSTMLRNENRHYIGVAGSMVVVKTYNANTVGAALSAAMTNVADDIQYWHRDSLGSVVAVSNATGDIKPGWRTGFDPWGRRLLSNGVIDTSTFGPTHGDRGFTGHEHMDELGLIHMNGRVYDPVLARFLSGDPVVQAPEDLQNYNAYSYVLNNPLKYTDPSGNFWQIFAFFIGLVMAHEGNEYWSMVGKILMMASLQGEGGIIESGLGNAGAANCAAGPCQAASVFNAGGVGNAMMSAAVATAASPGASLEDVVSSALFAVAFNGAGNLSGPARMGAHMLLGCMQGAMGGGKCGPSAMAAFLGKGASEVLPDGLNNFERGLITTVVGGTASVVGGGKFANGAAQAAFGYLFNHWAHSAQLAAYGKEAHQLLQDYAKERGYVVESKCATPTNCVDGRFDIADSSTKEVWEIKRHSFFGLAMGELALEAYTSPETGLRRGGSLVGLNVGSTISLWKGDIEYQYTNHGDGSIGYSRFDHTPARPIRIYVPRVGPVPGGSRGHHDQFGY